MICNTCCNEYDGDICLTCYPYDTTKYVLLSDPKEVDDTEVKLIEHKLYAIKRFVTLEFSSIIDAFHKLQTLRRELRRCRSNLTYINTVYKDVMFILNRAISRYNSKQIRSLLE